jgi:hypothetical protein
MPNILWPSTASPGEVVWTILNLIGMIRWLQRYIVSVRQRRAAEFDSAELAPERIVYDIRGVRSIMVTDCLFAFVGIGVIAMTLPPSTLTDPQQVTSWVVGLLMVFVSLALIVTGEIIDRKEYAVAALVRSYQELSRSQYEEEGPTDV